jgi:opacity protein-like surface antigen
MGSFKTYAALAGCLALATSLTTARAADLLPPPPPMPEPIEEVGSSWYLRGDVGIGMLDYDKTIVRTVAGPVGVPTTGYIGRQKELGDQVFIGAGVGFAYSSFLRFDVTGEYRTQAHWRFVEQDTNFGPANFNITSGKLSHAVGLVNGYFDLGTWYGLSPFIGAGVGVAHHMFDGVNDLGAGGYAGGIGLATRKDKTDLAWALHAGIGYHVSPNLKLELAYRYLNMGQAEAGTIICQGTTASCGTPVLQTNYKLKDIESHDIKLGMRWTLNGPTEAYHPGPLMRKY